MSYTQLTVPPDTDSDLPATHQPGEPVAATLARAVTAHLGHQAWVPALAWDTNGVTAAARVTLAAAGARVTATLAWRAGQFTLSIDGRRDPLRHSGLAHRAEHLATLVTDTSPATVAELAERQVAERLAATIAYAGVALAAERAGADPALLAHQCAQCGEVDFPAATGGPTQLHHHRCPRCRGTAPPPESPPAGLLRRARRPRRPRPVQEALLERDMLPEWTARPHHGPLATWPLHRLLQQVTQERFTVWNDTLWEVLVDGRHRRGVAADPRGVAADPRDVEQLARLRRAGLVYVSLWLFVDIDGRSRETHHLALSKHGWALLRRWDLLHPGTVR